MGDPTRMNRRIAPILLIGAKGMLGQAWCALLTKQRLTYTATTRSQLDITDKAALEKVLDDRYDIAINCAAWTNVDAAETHSSDANLVNGTAVGQLADRCAATNTFLVHFSTDYVFDGHGVCPYAIDHPVDPVNAYGRSKLIGERLLQESGCRHLLLRTSWLYAPWGNNFVRTIVRLSAERQTLKVVDDQRGRPTSTEHLANVTLGILGHEHEQNGTFHVTDGGECTWFEFASCIAKHTNPRCQVEPCSTDAFPRPAPRPAYSVLDLSRTEDVIGPMSTWKDNLSSVLGRLTPMISESQ